jgi:Arc/MetJ-type ribon-helix-helix transcriptional regulator
MNVSLSTESEAIVHRLTALGKFCDASEVVQAGLRKLEAELTGHEAGIESFPPGSLAAFFTDERNAEELALLKGSSLKIENA